MTEWNELSRRSRKNQPHQSGPFIHVTEMYEDLVRTHPGVCVPPGLWHVSWQWAAPNCLFCLKVLVVGVSQTEGDLEEERVEGGCLLMLPKRLSFPLYRITPSLSWSSRHSLRSLNSPSLLSAAARGKSAGAFGSFRKFLMCTRVPIHGSNEWTTQKRQSAEGSKQPDSVCCECIIWAAELPCASVCTSFCRRESGLGPGWTVLGPKACTYKTQMLLKITAKTFCKRATMYPQTVLSMHCSQCQITVKFTFSLLFH